MAAPTFFISSTIYDFTDLRSALKFNLEAYGCKVLTSEANDFEKPLDIHSYDACLKAIHLCDYFILLIGDRTGGWYDERARVSITRREYREAQALQQAGKLKILAFVRERVWNHAEVRKELRRYLKNIGLPSDKVENVANFSSQFSDNPNHLISFLKEVGKNEETKAALNGAGSLPRGNWIHQFSSFKDIMDAIHAQILGKKSIQESTLNRALASEIESNLSKLLLPGKDKPLTPKKVVRRFADACKLTKEDRFSESLAVPSKEWREFASYLIHFITDTQLDNSVLREALLANHFMVFDPITNSVKATKAYDIIQKINSDIIKFNKIDKSKSIESIFKYTPRARPDIKNRPEFEMSFLELALPLSLSFSWVNMIEMNCKFLVFLETGKLNDFDLMPISPILGMEEEIKKETVSRDAIREYLGLNGRN